MDGSLLAPSMNSSSDSFILNVEKREILSVKQDIKENSMFIKNTDIPPFILSLVLKLEYGIKVLGVFTHVKYPIYRYVFEI